MTPEEIKRLKYAADLLVDYIIDWNVNANKVHIPNSWKNYLGFTDAEIENTVEGWMKIANGKYMAELQTLFASLIAGSKEVIQTEIEVVRKDGSSLWVYGKGKVVEWNTDNTAARIIVVYHEIDSRKKIEFELDKSENRFKNIFNQHSSVMLLVEPDSGEIIDANKSAQQFYGYTLQQMRAMKISDINGLTAEELHKVMQELVKQHNGFYIFRHQLASGEIRHVEVRSTSIEENNKTVLFSIITDISDKIVAENLLLQEKESLNAILKTLPDIIFRLDINNHFSFCHTNALDELIMPPQEFLGKHITEVLPESIASNILEKISRAHQSSQLQELRYSIEIPAKGLQWYEARIVVVNDGGTIVVVRDITDGIKDNEQRRLLELAVANATDAVIITEAEPFDMPGPRIVFVNDAFEKNTGYSREEVLGKTPRLLQGKKSDRKELGRLRKAIEKWEPCEIEIINYKKNGEEFWVNLSVVPLANEKGSFTHWVAIQKDITERKRTEEQLKKMSQAIEQSPSSIMITDINANIEYVNLAFTKLSGYSVEEIVGQNARILKTEHTSVAEFKNLAIALKNKEIWRGEFVNKNKEGELFWEYTVISPILDKEGAVTNFLSVKENITERKKVEKHLAEKLNIIEAGQKIANVGYFIAYYNQKGEVDPTNFMKWDVSPTLYSMLNIDSAFQGEKLESWLQLIHPEDSNRVAIAFTDLIFKNREVDLKVRLNDHGRQIIQWIRFHGNVEVGNTGRPLYIILYIEDVTEVEKLLNDREMIIESIADNFYVLDSNFNFIYYNLNFSNNYLKVSNNEFIGKNLFEVFPFLTDSVFPIHLKKAATTKEAVHFELEVTDEGGFMGWYEQHIYPFYSGYSVLFRNITDRKKIEEDRLKLNAQLKLSSEELINTNTELERFAYVASHDLQEPLRMVSSFMQLFEKKYSAAVDDTGKQYIRFAVEGADRMKILIRDLLQYSRAGSGSLEIIDVDMNEVMNEVQLIFRNDTAQINADIITAHLPVIRAGKTAMLQLMQNLISNALKYNDKEKAVITISGEENDNEWMITVKDNGIGIEAEFADKIFVIFQRLHTKEQYGGTGIGLSVCKKIVEKYKGKIWVKSTPGIGSAFIFTIPKSVI
ncbi:MAG: PAS domain S-box protein [Ferruginibacter sp.]